MRRDRETECVDSRGVVCTKSTNSVSLGSERCLKRWELTTPVCVSVCVCVHVHRDATFDKHGEITMQCCQRVLSLAGVWKRGRSVIFSDEQRTRDDASYRFAQAHLHKHDTCMPAHAYVHIHVHQGLGFEFVHLSVMARSPIGQEV